MRDFPMRTIWRWVSLTWICIWRTHDPVRMADAKTILDRLIVRPDDPDKLLWWWCDALFMAPPVLARMFAATGDQRYLNYMDREWWQTSASLYDPAEHLYFRDSRYFTQKEKNGQKIFWSRGNGWVMGAFAKVLEVMPKDYPGRGKYIAQYKEMADRIAAIQGEDGLWRSGLLDPAAYDLPEVSGTAFFTYSLAWGINHGILDRAKFEPVVERAWAGMLSHIYADGRSGSIQPIDGQPGKFKPSASSVYGVGGFLLAASELDALAQKAAPVRPRITGISHVGYFVSDLPRAIAFWHDLLGYDESYELNKNGSKDVRIAFIKINDHQHIELFNEAPTSSAKHDEPHLLHHRQHRADAGLSSFQGLRREAGQRRQDAHWRLRVRDQGPRRHAGRVCPDLAGRNGSAGRGQVHASHPHLDKLSTTRAFWSETARKSMAFYGMRFSASMRPGAEAATPKGVELDQHAGARGQRLRRVHALWRSPRELWHKESRRTCGSRRAKSNRHP